MNHPLKICINQQLFILTSLRTSPVVWCFSLMPPNISVFSDRGERTSGTDVFPTCILLAFISFQTVLVTSSVTRGFKLNILNYANTICKWRMELGIFRGQQQRGQAVRPSRGSVGDSWWGSSLSGHSATLLSGTRTYISADICFFPVGQKGCSRNVRPWSLPL